MGMRNGGCYPYLSNYPKFVKAVRIKSVNYDALPPKGAAKTGRTNPAPKLTRLLSSVRVLSTRYLYGVPY